MGHFVHFALNWALKKVSLYSTLEIFSTEREDRWIKKSVSVLSLLAAFWRSIVTLVGKSCVDFNTLSAVSLLRSENQREDNSIALRELDDELDCGWPIMKS